MSDDKVTFTTREEDREYLAEPKQPKLTGNMPRIRARGSQLVDGVRFFSPHMPQEKQVQILGVGVAPCPEEASALLIGNYADQQVKPRLLKGPCGTLISDSMNRFANLSSDKFAYTVVIPWLLPKSRRFKPKKEEVAWATPALHDFIAETKPRMILAFGKAAFEQLVDYKIAADDAKGGWFSYKDTGIPVYLMDPITVLLTQPWSIDTLITDFREVDRMMASRYGQRGIPVESIPLRWQEIRTIEQLEALVAYWEANNFTRFSVDCEWAGIHFIDGRLRSIQFCWSDEEAAYLNFFDETGTHILGAEQVGPIGPSELPIHPNQSVGPGEFYTDYRRVGEILGRWLNRPGITYMGHHFSADSVWMEHWLGLEIWDRCEFDLEFAKQTVNEYSRLGLDVMALEYTDFGRYDMELVMWKKANAKLMKEDEGYGKIPDAILIPYAVKDVAVVWRAYPHVMAELHNQELTGYYRTFVLPFVSNTFHTFITTGLPVDPMLFDLTRKFFNWAYRALLEDFRNLLTEQADELLAAKAGIPMELVKIVAAQRDAGKAATAAQNLRNAFPDTPSYLIDHWAEIRGFNIRSTPNMIRWLFQVLEMTPVKTTKNPNNGMPSMMWDRVMELPEKLRATLKPAVDKETIEILSATDTTGSLVRLLAVSNVGNQCKGFLKEGEVDEEGEVIKENGLKKFIGHDDLLRPNYSLTETMRPRGWKPNPLNLSKYHNKGVEQGLIRIIENKDNNPRFIMPDEFDALFGTPEQRKGRKAKDLVKKDMPSIRSTIKAQPGGCFVESDYKTAEIRGQAFISGDETLINLLIGFDESFALCGEDPVRLSYPEDAGIAKENHKPEFLMAVCKEGKTPMPVTLDQLNKRADGSLVHPGYDLHWSLAEMSQGKPREMMNADRDRGAGKVSNFSGAYGAVGVTLERRIEAITGIKPEPGTGESLLNAMIKRQPVSMAFSDSLASMPKTGQQLKSAAGRIRHFPVHSSELQGMPWRIKNSYLRAMGNEARNFLFQESVASTLSRACLYVNNFARKYDMKARTAIGLYDALLTYCPDQSERFVVAEMHQVFMTDINVWHYHNRWMNYPIDTDLCYRWSWKPTEDEKLNLHNPAYCAMDANKSKFLMDTLYKIKEDFFAFQPDILPRLNVI